MSVGAMSEGVKSKKHFLDLNNTNTPRYLLSVHEGRRDVCSRKCVCQKLKNLDSNVTKTLKSFIFVHEARRYVFALGEWVLARCTRVKAYNTNFGFTQYQNS